ncbi:TonB-dependent receptor [Dysgonomonas sp.]|jgi:TonB-linked SusC/RagA family outer membrane protein|uniref:SusC/RagA family TonB-linked outer membrane protein n=2 Tax=unclassified Dysgonomonas TaxID=2630389 RepID=UPI002D07F2B5|nr:TonB-dependent receptor [Dysgonomonas sp.]HMM02336.1 TonB-dependent receptor [Dysgonomonas sp.]
MTALKQAKKKFYKKLLCILFAGLILSTAGSMNVQASPGKSNEPSDLLQAVRTVKGTVKDRTGNPLIGVSVTIKGTTTGTITDIDGKYSINAAANQTINFSYIGFKPISMLANQTEIDVIMEEDSQIMDEIVVVGYGTQRKENLTGAVASVDVGKTLDSRPIADVGRSLQGSVPGLSIVIPSGEVGSDPIFRIRGQIASINSTASNSPLILLDNVEIPSITLVNPDDIESISVLKDAAASSIYGAKAALGVILITTKKGAKTDKITVQYSNNFSWSKVAKDIDMATLDGLEYAMLAIERVGTNMTGAFWKLDRTSYEKSKAWIAKYGNSVDSNDPILYGRDWYVNGANKMGVRMYNPYDYMIEEWTPTQTHNLSVNGMSGKVNYNIGLGYFDQKGLMKTAKKDEFQRYNATAKISSEINKYITIRSGFLFSQRTKYYPYITNSTTADPWLYLYRWGPLQPFGTENGNLVRSPASEAAQANTASQQTNYLNVNLGATLNFTKDWNLEFDYTFANNEYLQDRPGTRYTAADSWSAAIPRTDENGNQIYVNENGDIVPAGTTGAMQAYQLPVSTYTSKGANPDHIYRESENKQQHTFNLYSTYNLNLADFHQFKFMAGLNAVKSKTKSHWAQKTELLDITNPQFDMATGTQTSGGKTYWESQAGFFGRVNYAFQQKYLLEGNLRYDGTSKFPTDLKWRWFPSFSAGWRANEEAFMEWAKPTLNSLKFRGSWGVIGDQSVSSGLYMPTLAYSTSTWLDGTTKFPYYGTPLPVDRYITWQDFETLDFGVDVVVFNGLNITFDWYQRYTRNMITPGLTLPYTFGAPAPVGNYGELRTRGWEITLDYNHRFANGLSINAMFTLSDAETYITDYDESAIKGTAADSYWKGKRYGDIWGYKTDRLYQADDFEYNPDGSFQTIIVDGKTMNKLKGDNPVYQPFVQNSADFKFGPGDVKYKDLDGDGKITNGSNTADEPGDLAVIGNTTPRYNYGFRVGADYKGFDVQLFFQGVGKRDIWGDGALAIPGYNVSDGAMSQAIAGDFWREDRTNAFYPRPYNIGAVAGGSTASNNTHVQDRYLLNMAYLRLKNVTFGYSLPANIIRKAYLTKARVYMSMENIHTWDHLRGLPIDPEVINGYSMYNTSNYNSGRTGVGAPMFKNVSFGVQLTF